MATIALWSKISIVFVILIMATTTRAGHPHFLLHLTHMALVAIGDIFMRPSQLKVGFIVIKIPRLPVTRVMTFLTFGTQTTLMHLRIIFFMARPAVGFRILKGHSTVALLTLDQGVIP